MFGRVALLSACRSTLLVQRSLTVTPVCFKSTNATDPIQQLFLDKVRNYAQKSKAAGGKLVDATPEVEAKYKAEIERVQKQYGVAAAGEDLTKFPVFNFTDSELEPVGVNVDLKPEGAAEAAASETEEVETPFFVY